MREDQQRLREAALEALRSEQTIKFLAALTWELTLAARGEYGSEGSMPPGSEYPLRCYNELLHRTSMQMCQAVGVPHGGYPNEDFIDMLLSEAARGDRLNSLESAVARVLRLLSTDSADS
jgi:hypothetical protein